MRRSIEAMKGKQFNSLTLLGLSAGTVYSSQSATFVDARCACGRVRKRVPLKSLVHGSVKACRPCAERGRRDKARQRRKSGGGLGSISPHNYRTFLDLFSKRERGEYDRLMKRHGRCEECAKGHCAADAVSVVMAERGKPREHADASHLHERRDFRWQFEG